jgi:hypothetical protein
VPNGTFAGKESLIMRTTILVILAMAFPVLFVPACSTQYAEAEEYETPYEEEYEYDDPDFAFYAELNNYGEWRVIGSYGTVWQPYVTAGWQPYYHGHWAWTNHGWMWVSYERFGWPVYHYGYWVYEPPYGWCWIPGDEWAPCRVTWVVYDNYVSWAPLPPPGVRLADPWSRSRVNVWITVHADRFDEPNVTRYRVKPKYKSSQYMTRVATHQAPDVQTVARFKGRAVPKVNVELEREQTGDRQFERARLPREQERVVERYRVDTPSKAKVQGKSKYRSERPSSKKEKSKRGQKSESKSESR